MHSIFYKKSHITAILICLALTQSFCTKNLQKETQVYKNDFESDNLNEISAGIISDYNGSKVLGRYSKGGYYLNLNSLPEHDLVIVSFDLYIHDNWNGTNPNGSTDDSDIWIMNFNGNSDLYTTFSNGTCKNSTCNYQSYPAGFPFQDNPVKANSIKTDLPGACSKNGTTTKYRITRTTYHSSTNFQLACFGQLFKHEKLPDPSCDASWSVDNIIVKVVKWRS